MNLPSVQHQCHLLLRTRTTVNVHHCPHQLSHLSVQYLLLPEDQCHLLHRPRTLPTAHHHTLSVSYGTIYYSYSTSSTYCCRHQLYLTFTTIITDSAVDVDILCLQRRCHLPAHTRTSTAIHSNILRVSCHASAFDPTLLTNCNSPASFIIENPSSSGWNLALTIRLVPLYPSYLSGDEASDSLF